MSKEVKEILRDKVNSMYAEYRDYLELIKSQNKDKASRAEEIKKVFEENKNDDEVKKFAFDVFIVDGFHKEDLKLIGTKFVHYVQLYKEIPDYDVLDDDVEELYNYLKENLPKRVFVVKQDSFVEVTKGFIKSAVENYEKRNMFERLKDELEKYL